ncbi:MAG: dihydrodipicolinate synthase family protein [Ruminococcaceae bacterium]|nr:dihydrodipicolinate synthase family protein [Oscillospiraceae bacterium]
MNRHEIALKKLAEGTVIPATPLALNEDRTINEKGLRLLMNYYLASGAGGIATAVHTTQFEIRDPEIGLFEPVIRIVSEEIDRYEKENDTVIIKVAGACGPVEQAVAEAKLAKKYGYDAVLLSPGGLNHLSEDEMIARTKAVAEVMPVIGFYLQTAVGGRVFTYNYWERLCAIDNVVAIKCASFNRYQTLDVVRAAAMSPRKDDITLYTGNDDSIVIDLLTKFEFDKNGEKVTKCFEGGLLGHWTMWTNNVVQMLADIKAEREKDAISAKFLTLAAQVTDANGVFFDAANGFAGCIPGVHEVLRRQGLMGNILCLNPNETLSPGQSEEIDRIQKAYPHLNDDAFIKKNLESWKARVE